MQRRAKASLRYIYLSLIASLKLVGVVVVFLAVRYWWGIPAAVIVSSAALTIVASVLVMLALALRVQEGSSDGQRAADTFRVVLMFQLFAMLGLLIASLVLRFAWLSAGLAVWAMILLVVISRWRRTLSISAQACTGAREPAARLQLLWTIAAAFIVYLSLAALTFIFNVMDFWTLFLLIAIVSVVLGIFVTVQVCRISTSRNR